MDYLRVGIISKPQGIHGELKITPLTDNDARFLDIKRVFVESKDYAEYTAENARVGGNGVFVKLKGIDDRNAAELLRGKYLCVAREDAAKLPEGRYFICDLEGASVFTDSGKSLGVLKEVLQYPANDVYAIDSDKPFLVPALKSLILSVDIQGRQIVFDEKILEQVAVYNED